MKNKHRPLITFSVTAFNQENFIREAIQGAFDQTYSPLEIILSDDCSEDSSFKIMNKMAESYQGPHKIVLNRNKNNLGIAAHTNKIINLANGEIIVFADGDDISMPERTQRSYDLLETYKDCYYLNFSFIVFYGYDIKKKSQREKNYTLSKIYLNKLDLSWNFPVSGATTIVKAPFQNFGDLLPTTPVQDSPIQLRYLLAGPILKSDEPQIFYRIHSSNLAASHNKYKLNFDEIHHQYLEDLDKALENRLIDSDTFIKVRDNLHRKLEQKKIEVKYHLSNNRISVYFSSILFSKLFSIKVKIKYTIKSFFYLLGIKN